MGPAQTAIRADIENMLWAFRKNAAALFEPTKGNEYREYQKGLYGILFVMPSRSVGRLLAAHREIVVIATSFADLQARTTQLAIDIIDGSDGRLENTLAIILHQDPAGNSKLRNWGRDVGLTVIPLMMTGNDLPSGEQLERNMLAEFYSHDPFDVTGPVSDDHQFYGRRDEAQDLARQLQGGQVRACLGIRRSGKTSLLHRVLEVMETYHNCYSVVIDCSKDLVWRMNAGELLAAIADGVTKSVHSEDYCSEIAEAGTTSSLDNAYRWLLAAVRSAPGTVVLLFDEVDYITPSSPTAPDRWASEFNPFWRNLRAAFQECARSASHLSVFVGGVSSKWFRTEAIGGVENAALAFLPEEYLLPLTPGASSGMIMSIGRTSGLLFEDEGAAYMADACSHIPFWIRKVGSYIHRATEVQARPRRLPADVVARLVDACIDIEGAAIAELALSHLFRVYPELTAVAAHCLDRQSVTPPRHLVHALEKYGVIAMRDGEARISGRMMEAGLRLHFDRKTHEASRVPTTAVADTDRLKFASTDEWAMELALVGTQRNKIEKRLRAIAVNFLRFDAAQAKQKGTLGDRLLKVVQEERKGRLRSLATDEMIEQFLWTELVALVQREWPLFSAIFGDKAAFSLHCTQVNARYDAHAKDVDKADLALYRRSLAWLEGCLSAY